EWYTQLAWRSRSLWLELEREHSTRLFEPIGVAWFAHRDDGFEADSRLTLEANGIPCEWLDPDDARRLYPSLGTRDPTAVLFEPDSGVLNARRATQTLVADAQRHGLRLEHHRAAPDTVGGADITVWACGAWLPGLFPGLVDLQIARRDVFFFGGDGAWEGTPG